MKTIAKILVFLFAVVLFYFTNKIIVETNIFEGFKLFMLTAIMLAIFYAPYEYKK